MQSPYISALSNTGSPSPKTPMQNPQSMSANGTTLFIDKARFGGNCKRGELYEIIGKVESVGDKIGLTIERIEPTKEEEESAEAEEKSDNEKAGSDGGSESGKY